MTKNKLSSQIIKNDAYGLGISKVGIAKADFYPYDKHKLDTWLNNRYHASMHWIKKRSTERSNIFNYYPNAKSVISVALNYFTGNASKNPNIAKFSNYAWGDDYHQVLKHLLYKLSEKIKVKNPGINTIVCVDTSPIMEKQWGQRAGIGWIGKHTNLITKEFGSWFFLGEIILDNEVDSYDSFFSEDLCGTCTECIDQCPTDAIVESYLLDSSKCISYMTIEHREDFNIESNINLYDWIYGCDICQEVCPWSKKYWSQQKIDIQEWTGEILALDDYVARVYKHPLASAKQLESMMNTFNEQRPDEEWLYSSPEYGGHSTPIGVLIQQDYNLLNRIRKSLKSNKYT